MEKITNACFIGGALGALTCAMVTPTFWWLGALAGCAAGFLSYEFRAVLKVWGGVGLDVIRWFYHLPPFVHIGIIFVFAAWIAGYAFGISPSILKPRGAWDLGDYLLLLIWLPESIILPCFAFFVWTFLGHVALQELNIGCLDEPWDGSYFQVTMQLIAGIVLLPIALLYCAVMIPVLLTLTLQRYVLQPMWEYLLEPLVTPPRVICGVCALVGTTLAYLRFGNRLETTADVAVLIAAGGLIGAALGAVAWRATIALRERHEET